MLPSVDIISLPLTPFPTVQHLHILSLLLVGCCCSLDSVSLLARVVWKIPNENPFNVGGDTIFSHIDLHSVESFATYISAATVNMLGAVDLSLLKGCPMPIYVTPFIYSCDDTYNIIVISSLSIERKNCTHMIVSNFCNSRIKRWTASQFRIAHTKLYQYWLAKKDIHLPLLCSTLRRLIAQARMLYSVDTDVLVSYDDASYDVVRWYPTSKIWYSWY